jgi:type I restriction enzyme S subunit
MSNLPKGWEEVNFDNFFKTISAKKYQIQKKDYLQKSIYPVIDQGQKFIIAYSNQSDKLLKNSSGLIIFGDHTRIIKFIDFDFIVGADGTQILDTKSNVDIKFAYYTLLFKEIVSLGYSRHFKIIKEFNYLVPPLEEQKKIADILSIVDKKIAFVEENINATEELKKGLMQKLLTEGIDHTEFKDSELGRIPENWEVVQQSEVAIFYNGRAYKLSEWEGVGTPVIRLQNLTGTGTEYYYSTLQLPEHQYCINGDLLYMWSATFGPVWWKGEKAIYHYHIWKITTEENKLDRNFLFYLLDQITVRMKKQSHGSTMIHVTKGGMEKLKIQLPPLEEQKQIAEILSTVDNKLENLKEKKESFEELKKGLMQKLLTGEVRV